MNGAGEPLWARDESSDVAPPGTDSVADPDAGRGVADALVAGMVPVLGGPLAGLMVGVVVGVALSR